MATNNSWYAINKKDDDAEILIYDEIGAWGVSAKQFINDLRKIDSKSITVRVNSPGGEIFDGTAIYNALRAHGSKIDVRIEGLAASAASFIAMAGDEINMANNAYMMIHNAYGAVAGGASDMRTYADMLEKINDNIAGMYETKAGKDRQHWRNLMDAETWFTANEAKDAGLVDAVYESGQAMAKAGAKFLTIYNKIPDAVRTAWGQVQPAAPALQKEPIMAEQPDTSTTSTPAQNPAAGANVPQGDKSAETIVALNQQTIQSYIDRGRTLGQAEGRQMERDRLKALMDACPGKPELVMNAFVTNQGPEAAKMVYEATINTQREAEARSSADKVEIARLQALVATGGHSGVSINLNSAPSIPDGLSPESQAELEYDGDPMVRARVNNNKKQWILFRANQIKGGVRILKTA